MKQAVLSSALFLTIIPLFQTFTRISSDSDKSCSDDTTCASLDSCPFWKEKQKEFRRLNKIKAAPPELLKQLRSAVCNKKRKVVMELFVQLAINLFVGSLLSK